MSTLAEIRNAGTSAIAQPYSQLSISWCLHMYPPQYFRGNFWGNYFFEVKLYYILLIVNINIQLVVAQCKFRQIRRGSHNPGGLCFYGKLRSAGVRPRYSSFR